ncbi:MAG: GrpB family protein [Planctomycetota bacterium]
MGRFAAAVDETFAPLLLELGFAYVGSQVDDDRATATFHMADHELTLRYRPPESSDLGRIEVTADGEPLRGVLGSRSERDRVGDPAATDLRAMPDPARSNPHATRSEATDPERGDAFRASVHDAVDRLRRLLPPHLHAEFVRRHHPTEGGVVVVPPQPFWPRVSLDEAARIAPCFEPRQARVEPIGSTSVPGLQAKPIIDLLIEAENIAAVDAASSSIVQLGYEAMGEYGLPGRRYFRRELEPGVRLYHVHAFERGSEGAIRHLAFRDYLRAHREVAAEYGALKCRLADRHSSDVEAYMDGKNAFIQKAEQDAVAWWRSMDPSR